MYAHQRLISDWAFAQSDQSSISGLWVNHSPGVKL